MKILNSIIKFSFVLTTAAVFITSCNKLQLDAVPIPTPTQDTIPTLATLLDAPDFTLLKAAVVKAGLLSALGNASLRFTLFAPDNAAITRTLTPILPPGVTPEIYINNILKGGLVFTGFPYDLKEPGLNRSFTELVKYFRNYR